MNSSSSSAADSYELISAYQNLQNIDFEYLSSKLKLLFQSLPSFKDFAYLHQYQKTTDNWDPTEELLLQLIVLSQNPKCIKSRFDWEKVQKAMPRFRKQEELYFKFQSFYKTQIPRQPWSEFEDSQLLCLIQNQPAKKWNEISRKYNSQCQSSVFRNAKQCRERWINKLDPQINRQEFQNNKSDSWSKSEELHFLYLLLQHGRKWADISLKLSMVTNLRRRTEFALKHKYKQILQNKRIITNKNSDYIISSKWTPKESDVLISRIETLKNKMKQQRFYISEFQYQDTDFLLVIIKNGKLSTL